MRAWIKKVVAEAGPEGLKVSRLPDLWNEQVRTGRCTSVNLSSHFSADLKRAGADKRALVAAM